MVATPKSSSLCIAYVTVPTRNMAKKIADAAVKRKLAACAVILGPADSVYRWKGKTEYTKECVVLLKTASANYKKLESYIRSMHPYDCPCILKLRIDDANKAYAKWVAGTAKPPSLS